MTLTFPKWGLGSHPGLPNLQSLIVGVKTPCLDVLYTIGKVSKCKCRKWPRMSHLNICNHFLIKHSFLYRNCEWTHMNSNKKKITLN